MKRIRQDLTRCNGRSWLANTNRSVENPKNAGTHRAAVMAAILLCLSYAIIGCASGIQGTYTESGGNYMLVLKSGGKAELTVARVTTPCTYTQAGTTLTLTCEDFDDTMIFTVHDDGSLVTTPGNDLPTLKKK